MTERDRPILLIASNYPPVRGGSASVYANLARCAARRVIVLASRLNYADGLPIIGWREHDRQASYRILRLPLLRTTIGRSPRGARKLLFLAWDAAIRMRLTYALLRLVIIERVCAICVGELLASAWVIHLARWIPGVRTVAYVHGEEITTRNASDPGNRIGYHALQHCDDIIVVSRFTFRAVEKLLGRFRSARIHMIENGVNTQRFCPAEKSAALMRFYGLEGCFVFVSVCRLVQKKGIDNTIRAFAELLRSHPDSRYLIVGTGPFRDELEAIAKQERVENCVIFAGQVAEEELVEHYQLGDVFIMPNRRMPDGDTEGFGLVFLEANGCGLPVVAGRDGGSTDAVQHGTNGLVVDGHSVEAIVAAMRQLRDDRHLLETLRQGALAAARLAGWAEKTRHFVRICSGTDTEVAPAVPMTLADRPLVEAGRRDNR